jgi:HEAT repeat protein
MNSNRSIRCYGILLVVHAAGCVAGLGTVGASRAHAYQIQTDDDVIQKLAHEIRSPDEKTRLNALARLRAMGPVAVDPLLTIVNDPSGLRAPNLGSALNRIERLTALVALGMMGAEASDAVPKLATVLETRDDDNLVRAEAAWTLAKIGAIRQEVVPALRKTLNKDQDPVVLGATLNALGSLGPSAVSAIEEVRALLEVDNPAMCREAADTIGKFGPAARIAIRDLADLLVNPKSTAALRRSAANSLRQMHEEAIDAFKELKRALSDKDLEVRRAATDAIAELGAEAASALEDIKSLLAEKNPKLTFSAMNAMRAIGPGASSALSELNEILEAPDGRLWQNAADAVAAIGPDERSIHALTALLDGGHPAAQRSAADALAKAGKRASSSVASLHRLLGRDCPPDVRRSAADALASIGQSASMAVGSLSRGLSETTQAEVSLKLSFANALGQIGQAGPEARKALKQMTYDHRPALRHAAIVAIRLIEPDGDTTRDQSFVQHLTALVADKGQDPRVQRAAIEELGQIGTSAAVALGPLKDRLRDSPTWEIRRSAANALRRISSPDANPALADALEDPHWDVCRSAAYALLWIGPGSGSVEQLTKALESPDWVLSGIAADALAKMSEPPVRRLIDTLRFSNRPMARANAAVSLRQLKSKARTAVGELRQRVINDSDPDVRSSALSAIKEIDGDMRANADRVQDSELNEYASIIRPILNEPKTYSPIDKPRFDELSQDLDSTDKSLKQSLNNRWRRYVWGLFRDNKVISLPLFYALSMLLIWTTLYFLRRSSLVTISESLTRLPTISVPKIELKLSWTVVRWGTFLGFFDRQSGVLDRWVAEKLPRARESFRARTTVKDRAEYVSSVHLAAQGVLRSSVDDELLTEFLRDGHATLLIEGPPGCGKTSLACYIALRASGAKNVIGPHPMLPVMIEPELVTDLHPQAGESDDVSDSNPAKPARVAGHSGLIELIRGLLRSYLGEPHAPSAHLVESLLRTRRVLVIVDRYSEMREPKKLWLNLAYADSPVNALIVTSRDPHPELKTGWTLKPLPIPVNNLNTFIRSYLRVRDKLAIFSEEDIKRTLDSASARPRDGGVLAGEVKRVIDTMIIEKSRDNSKG